MEEKIIEELSYEEAFEEMNRALKKLEEGNATLDESLALYEYGIKLYKHMNQILEKAELKISQIKEEIE